ncbi:MAG: tRNA threonylcarbamoyladenosine biosynthesis protein TsaE [Patiriisocius sp.]|jgi:tRNA threonylcarbamoyladenosine biosynthesis protein TsaE
METMHITDISELDGLAQNVLQLARGQKSERAVVCALHGDLGAGKTTFTQVLARTLGVTEIVTSPTFVVMKKYPLENQAFEELVHIDAYRIEEIDEMRVLGFESLLEEKETIMCIEWAENIKELLPKDTIHVTFEHAGENRNITITHGNQKP